MRQHSAQSMLMKAGLTNSETDYLDIVETRESVRVPYCTSLICTGRKSKRMVRKYLERQPDYCPDCHSALFYRNEKKSSNLIGP